MRHYDEGDQVREPYHGGRGSGVVCCAFPHEGKVRQLQGYVAFGISMIRAFKDLSLTFAFKM